MITLALTAEHLSGPKNFGKVEELCAAKNVVTGSVIKPKSLDCVTASSVSPKSEPSVNKDDPVGTAEIVILLDSSIVVIAIPLPANNVKSVFSELANNVPWPSIVIVAKEFEDVKLSYEFPLATIYNLIGPKYYFSNLKKILYVDADVIFNDDISELWEKKLNFPVAAVIDSHIGVVGNPSMKRPWRELKVDPLAQYLNTGLLLIDVQKWNDEEITEKCLELLRTFEMPCIDQDALSLVLGGNFDVLHPRYNLMPFHLTPRLRFSDVIENPIDLAEAIKNPAIIHFHRSFFDKPWNFGCTHPYKNLWRKYATQFDKKWHRKIDFYNLVRNFGARVVGLTDLDSETISNSKFGAD
jgi:lipopolysaccharide biosynthesis glycosyltransferase